MRLNNCLPSSIGLCNNCIQGEYSCVVTRKEQTVYIVWPVPHFSAVLWYTTARRAYNSVNNITIHSKLSLSTNGSLCNQIYIRPIVYQKASKFNILYTGNWPKRNALTMQQTRLLLPLVQKIMNKLLCAWLLVALTAIVTKGAYNDQEINSIVVSMYGHAILDLPWRGSKSVWSPIVTPS